MAEAREDQLWVLGHFLCLSRNMLNLIVSFVSFLSKVTFTSRWLIESALVLASSHLLTHQTTKKAISCVWFVLVLQSNHPGKLLHSPFHLVLFHAYRHKVIGQYSRYVCKSKLLEVKKSASFEVSNDAGLSF